jgi:hypothetical protein
MKSRYDTQLIDQQGIGFISQQFAKIGCVLNEYSRETGIDAILEIRESNYTGSGKFIAVQLKSGDSFFSNETSDKYAVYMDNSHIDYWLKCYLPVVFIIFSPIQNKAYWAKIDKKTLIKTRTQFKISIPKENDVSLITKDALYQFFYGPLYNTDEEFEVILNQLESLRHQENLLVTISGLELYINGMLSLCTQLYFYTDLPFNLLEIKISQTDMPSFGFPSSDFFDEYFRILNFHNLLQGDFVYEIEALNEKELLPTFLKPLSVNGLRFNEFLRRKEFPVRDRIHINAGGYEVEYYLRDS